MMEPDKDYVMTAGFLGLCHYLIGQPDAIKAFEAETGFRFLENRTAIERMIDEATGATKGAIAKFIRWVEREHWGEPVPPSVADMLARLES